jgi:hypothetical protein
MATKFHIRRSSVVASLLAICSASLLAGCQLEPQLLAATSRSEGDEQIVTVTISADDAKSIKTREIYTWLVVGSCAGGQGPFPAESYVAGRRLSEFRFPISGSTVDLVGNVPAKIYAEYSQPCASLEGGGYLTGKIKSSVIPILGSGRGA